MQPGPASRVMWLWRGPAPSAAVPGTNGAFTARQTSLFLKLTRDWMLICLSCSFMLHQSWICFTQQVEA